MTKEKAYKYILLSVTMVSSFFNPFMGSSVNVALREISEEFSLSAISISWIAMAYLLASAVFLVPFGKITDMMGRKKIFVIGNIILFIGSVVCGMSPNGDWLIGFRFVQGIGSAMIFCSGMAMVISAFSPQNRGKVIGVNVFAVYVGLSAAPALGGFMIKALGWRSLFHMNAIASAFIIIAVIIWVKQEWSDNSKTKFDYLGSVLYMISMAAMMYGFSKLPDPRFIALVVLGVIVFVGFILVELKHINPVLDINLFLKSRTFAFSNIAALINYAATFAVSFLLSLYLRYVKGMSPMEAGTVLMMQPVFMAIVAIFSGWLSDKKDPRILASIGMSASVIGLGMFIFLTPDTEVRYILTSLAILGVGFGLFSSPNTNAIMGAVEKRFLGVASATVSTMRLTGQMFSMATATMVINLFIGDEKINPANFPDFMKSSHLLFIIFTVLCFLGVFASLARGKREK